METCDDYVCENATWRNFTVDTTHPDLENANNLTDLVTLFLPVNSTWNFTANDIHIDDCYYNTSDSATINVVTCDSEINTTWTTGGNKQFNTLQMILLD